MPFSYLLQHHNENILKVEQGGKIAKLKENNLEIVWMSQKLTFKNCQENKNNKTFWLEAKTLPFAYGFISQRWNE